MSRSIRGFTLIELMIVVAIVGILAAIAMPAYQRYVARAQTSEAVVLLEGARLSVDEYITQSGSFPATLNDLDNLGTVTSGKYVSSVYGIAAANGAGALVAEFKQSGVAVPIRGARLSFSRNTSGVWRCAPGPSQPVNQTYIPQACR